MLRLLALQRGAARGSHHGGGVRGDRELDVPLERALHDDGHRLDDGLRDGGAWLDPPGSGRDPSRRLAAGAGRRSRRPKDHRARRAGPEAVRHPHGRSLRERDPSSARDLGVDERDPAPDRVRGARGRRPAARALRRPLPLDAVARQSEAGRRAPDGGLLLRRRPAGRDGADRGPARPGSADRDRADGRREPGTGADRDHRPDGDPDQRTTRSTGAEASWSCAARSVPTER